MSPSDAAILVVDDNGDNRYTLCHRLRRQGCADLEEASNAREALERLAARPFDLVLLDIMMWDATLRSPLRAAPPAAPGRRRLASCGGPTHRRRSEAGIWEMSGIR